MKIALGVYAAVYALVTIVTIVDDLRSNDPLWDTASDVILLPLGLVGIVLYLLGVPHPDLKAAWKLVAPIIIAGQLATNLLGRYLWKKRNPTEDSDAIRFTDITATLLLVPMFMANLAFAYR